MNEVETLSAQLHEIYMAEAKRQGDVRHADRYEDLPENIKEFDRVLARFIIDEKRKAFLAGFDTAAEAATTLQNPTCEQCGTNQQLVSAKRKELE